MSPQRLLGGAQESGGVVRWTHALFLSRRGQSRKKEAVMKAWSQLFQIMFVLAMVVWLSSTALATDNSFPLRGITHLPHELVGRSNRYSVSSQCGGRRRQDMGNERNLFILTSQISIANGVTVIGANGEQVPSSTAAILQQRTDASTSTT